LTAISRLNVGDHYQTVDTMKTYSFRAVAVLATIASLFAYANSACAATIDVTVGRTASSFSRLRL